VKRKSPLRVVYGTRPPTPKQLAQKISTRCRHALGATMSEPIDRGVRDGEIFVSTPIAYDAGRTISGRFAWEAPFKMPVPVYAFRVYEYGVNRSGSELIQWAGQALVLPNLDVVLVDIFKKVPAHVRACIERSV
jgi:hypothetical protein